ncbi:MAG: Exodeoxyribonuclease 7 large subunit [Parcubacteria group bacterium GW2011_GWF2_38_76]|nr:MAG: Exodeoxyribonuclease 7 large subunit [Parcubacteria group bacterium GW2011_GWF2_38_76]HBM45489.1 exodeoxyribonuclease VII large subunit [Patescibacteria group bacterium]
MGVCAIKIKTVRIGGMGIKKKVKKMENTEDSSGGLFELPSGGVPIQPERDYFFVGEFLDILNEHLKSQKSFVAGEVTEFRAHDKWVSFSLKDKEDKSILKCFLSVWTYRNAGVLLEDGMEVKISGYPRIYKLAGTFSFNVETIEPLGEGSLKKAYLLLLKMLETEGLFSRKRPLPKFIQKIGVISSRDGVVIHDFRKNLKPLGFKINFYNSRVEGVEAVPGIIGGIKWLNKNIPDLDIIVIMRGGGSLESMQVFNNEQVCREIFSSKIPVLCGIGHEVDVPIACLVADAYVSTPTATAYTINESWDDLISGLPMFERRIISQFGFYLKDIFSRLPYLWKNIFGRLEQRIISIKKEASTMSGRIFAAFRRVFLGFGALSEKITKDAIRIIGDRLAILTAQIHKYEKILTVADPERNLRLGYSIVFNEDGRVIKDVKDIKKGELIKTKLGKGEIESEVIRITN